jgi:hypothetical protein
MILLAHIPTMRAEGSCEAGTQAIDCASCRSGSILPGAALTPRHWRLLHLFRRMPTVLPRPPLLASSGGLAYSLGSHTAS